MRPANNSLNTAVASHVAAQRPASLLALGPAAAALAPSTASRGAPPLRVHALPDARTVADLETDVTVDLALVAGLLEECDKRGAEIMLARLRDVQARRVLIVMDTERAAAQGWDQNAMFALGFERIQRVTESGRPFELYGFDIRRYKVTPDWLNARFWANPELWNKFRW
jgi:hypothetical protein